MKGDRQNVLSCWTIFCPFTRKINILKKLKKTPGDIIILHKYTKNHDYMLYCSWDMTRDRRNYFSFWAIFVPFYPLTAQKIKLKKNEKNAWRYHQVRYTSVPKIMIICYIVPEIWCLTDVIVIFHFGLFFTLLPT